MHIFNCDIDINIKKYEVDIYFDCSVTSFKSHQNQYPKTCAKGKQNIKM